MELSLIEKGKKMRKDPGVRGDQEFSFEYIKLEISIIRCITGYSNWAVQYISVKFKEVVQAEDIIELLTHT